MTERVLIEPGRMAVSLPGFNVHTASIDELAFDSRFASVGLAERGEVSVPRRAEGAAQPGSVTVAFARDYGHPPLFEMGMRLTVRPRNQSAFAALVPVWVHYGTVQGVTLETYCTADVYSNRAIINNWLQHLALMGSFYLTDGSPGNAGFHSATRIKWLAIA